MADLTDLVRRIQATPHSGLRRVIAITGAPASGKSTLAQTLQPLVASSCVVPMDGFHLDNEVLDARGLRSRKGSPATFNVAGFVQLIEALKHQDHISYPLFDRARDKAISDGANVGLDVTTVLVEGNYLMLRHGGWEALQGSWDLSLYLDVPLAELERRLLDRWTTLGLSRKDAEAKTFGNDLPNAKTVTEESFASDIVV